MSLVYQVRRKSDHALVALCECRGVSGYTHVVIVRGAIKAYCDSLGDAYRLYNEFAR